MRASIVRALGSEFRSEMNSTDLNPVDSQGQQWHPEASTLIPDREELGRYLEDTIVIDWQTPAVLERARALMQGLGGDEDELDRIDGFFRFVRDEIQDALESEAEEVACSASQVLKAGSGLVFARCHLLVALLRSCGFPAGLGYQRLSREKGGTRLHGFVGVWLARRAIWVNLDPCGRVASPLSGPPTVGSGLADLAEGDAEVTYPTVWARPRREVVDLLDQVPRLDVIRSRLPAALQE